MSALGAVLYREGKIRATNLSFIFWDLFYPLGYRRKPANGGSRASEILPAATYSPTQLPAQYHRR